MKLSMVILAICSALPLGMADSHGTCKCRNGGYNWRITSVACDNYGAGDAKYNAKSGHCEAVEGKKIDGDRWEASCRKMAKQGFECIDGKGTCYAVESAVRGDCD